MSRTIIDAEAFHPMRGHVADGVVVRFPDKSTMTLTNTMRGWTLVDAGGQQAFAPVHDGALVTRLIISISAGRSVLPAHP
jgi:hypothetical protein